MGDGMEAAGPNSELPRPDTRWHTAGAAVGAGPDEEEIRQRAAEGLRHERRSSRVWRERSPFREGRSDRRTRPDCLLEERRATGPARQQNARGRQARSRASNITPFAAERRAPRLVFPSARTQRVRRPPRQDERP